MSLLRRTVIVDRDGFNAAVEAGDRARDSHRWAEAVQAYRLALELNSEALHIATQLGHALKEAGDFAGAEEAYGRYLAGHPSDPDIHLQLGHLFNRQNRSDLAVEWYDKTVGLDNAGCAGLDAACELLRLRAMASDKRRQEIRVLTECRRYAVARELLTDLILDGAEDLVGLMGNVCKELGRFAEAEAWYGRYRAFAETAPVDVRFDAELQSGHFEKIQGNVASALSHYIRARGYCASAEHPTCSFDVLTAEIEECMREISFALVTRIL